MRALWSVAPQYILVLYQDRLRRRVFPARWKEARLQVLLKSPDKPRAEPRSYQQICLLSALGKVFETILVAIQDSGRYTDHLRTCSMVLYGEGV